MSKNKVEDLVKERTTLSRFLSLSFFYWRLIKKNQDDIIFNVFHVQVLNGIGTSEKNGVVYRL